MSRFRLAAVTIFVAAAVAFPALVAAAPAAGSGSTDPGRLPQTGALPSAGTPWFRARMRALWRGIVEDSAAAAEPAFFPRSAYLQVKPTEWTWITPGYCANRAGYWHAPGSRLVYRQGGRLRSFGVFSLISWRGEWYVVHLAVWDQPGTVDDPSAGVGAFGPPGGC